MKVKNENLNLFTAFRGADYDGAKIKKKSVDKMLFHGPEPTELELKLCQKINLSGMTGAGMYNFVKEADL